MWPMSIRKAEIAKTSSDLASALGGVDDVRRQLDELRATLREIQADVHAQNGASTPSRSRNGKVDASR